MKDTTKRILCLLLIAVLLFCSTSFSASAADETSSEEAPPSTTPEAVELSPECMEPPPAEIAPDSADPPEEPPQPEETEAPPPPTDTPNPVPTPEEMTQEPTAAPESEAPTEETTTDLPDPIPWYDPADPDNPYPFGVPVDNFYPAEFSEDDPYGIVPMAQGSIPNSMWDNSILRALAYTGFNVQKLKDNNRLYKYEYISGSLKTNDASVLSKIGYGEYPNGDETVSNSSTPTGKAPNIAYFEQNGLVEPDDASTLGNMDGGDYVTLITCTPYGVNSHRLLVRGKHVPYTPTEEADPIEDHIDPAPSTWREQYIKGIVLGITILAGLSLLVMAVWYVYCRKHRRRKRYKHEKRW